MSGEETTLNGGAISQRLGFEKPKRQLTDQPERTELTEGFWH